MPLNVRSASIFIPVSHVLEYREFWEDVDNDRIGLEDDSTEFEGYSLSSLKYAKGERAYYRGLR